MKKILKWAAIGAALLLGLLVLAAGATAVYARRQWKPVLTDRPLYEIRVDYSPEAVARGEYLVRSVMACQGCHSPNADEAWLAGHVELINEGPIRANFAVPNLTPDVETGLGTWTDAEIARAIREGVDKDNVGLVIMPSTNYHALSDADVAAIVAYLRSLEPVNNPIPPIDANAVGKVLNALGMMGPPALGAPITEAQPAPAPDTLAYGEYMTLLGACRDCHGSAYTGGTIPFAEPGTPPAPNLTATGRVGSWTEAQFVEAMQTGTAPDGRTFNDAMPWKVYQGMTAEDLGAIYRYLQSLPGSSEQ